MARAGQGCTQLPPPSHALAAISCHRMPSPAVASHRRPSRQSGLPSGDGGGADIAAACCPVLEQRLGLHGGLELGGGRQGRAGAPRGYNHGVMPGNAQPSQGKGRGCRHLQQPAKGRVCLARVVVQREHQAIEDRARFGGGVDGEADVPATFASPSQRDPWEVVLRKVV